MFGLKRVWDFTDYFEQFLFNFYCWIKMKVLFKHWLIKNKSTFDIDALMTFTIITRPFLFWYIHTYFSIFRGKCSGTEWRVAVWLNNVAFARLFLKNSILQLALSTFHSILQYSAGKNWKFRWSTDWEKIRVLSM